MLVVSRNYSQNLDSAIDAMEPPAKNRENLCLYMYKL